MIGHATTTSVREPRRRWYIPHSARMVDQLAVFLVWWGQTGGAR